MKESKVIKKKIVSLDIGHKFIKVAEGKFVDGKLKVMNTFSFDTPIQSIENGHINNLEVLVSAIKMEFAAKRIQKGYMNVVFHSDDMIERELLLPTADLDDIKEMVLYEIQQYLPIDINKYVIQHKITEEVEEDSRIFYRIMVTAVEREVIESYLDLIRKLGFKPYRFDVHSNAVDKVVGLMMGYPECRFKDKSVAFIDIGYKETTISMFSNGVFQMSQELLYGGYSMDILLEQRINFSREEVIRLKESLYNLTIYGDETDLENIPKKAIIDSLNEGTREIHTFFRYYASRKGERPVDEVVICGGVSHLQGIEAYLSSTFNLPVNRIDEYTSVSKMVSDIDNIGDYINAIGALISRR